jgi:hypothetical protein
MVYCKPAWFDVKGRRGVHACSSERAGKGREALPGPKQKLIILRCQ